LDVRMGEFEMKPLENVRIVSVEQYGAGPWGSLQLADLGAEVIKIEDPSVGGDVGRYVPPFCEDGDSLFFESFNRNKQSIALDISNSAGRSVFEDLVTVSDAVYSNLRGDVPSKLKLMYDDLKHLNPRIVCCSLTGYGMTGPRSAEPGYDYILQGYGGWMSLTGEPGAAPTKTGLSLVDYSGGYVAALSLLAALLAARRDGIGMDCDVSLFDTAISLLTYVGTWELNTDFVATRVHNSAHPSLVPFQMFEASDGWLLVACAKEKFWVRLAKVLGAPELMSDARFADVRVRWRHREILIPILEEIFLKKRVAEWLDVLQSAGVPCGPVNSIAQALGDPQTAARGMIVETDHPRFGVVRGLSTAVRVGMPADDHVRAPRLGETTEDILRGLLEYDSDRINALAAAGAFGVTPKNDSARVGRGDSEGR
jgi:crotonobetainyl-CoA:carnitine CoA-transferase CaiB-like acyl-CoA transferase